MKLNTIPRKRNERADYKKNFERAPLRASFVFIGFEPSRSSAREFAFFSASLRNFTMSHER